MFFHECRFCPPPCSIRIDGWASADAAPRFHSSATRLRPSTPRNVTVSGVLLAMLTDILSTGS